MKLIDFIDDLSTAYMTDKPYNDNNEFKTIIRDSYIHARARAYKYVVQAMGLNMDTMTEAEFDNVVSILNDSSKSSTFEI